VGQVISIYPYVPSSLIGMLSSHFRMFASNGFVIMTEFSGNLLFPGFRTRKLKPIFGEERES
jgi:hypothetical protein